MRLRFHENSFEEIIPTPFGITKYNITYLRAEYPILTEAEGMINNELISSALSKRSFIRNMTENVISKQRHISSYSSVTRPSYSDGMFVSFLCEDIMTYGTSETHISYSAKTYRISSAQPVTLEKLFRHPHIKPLLWDRLTQNSYDIFTKSSFDDFLMYYCNTDFYLTPESITLFFPPHTVIPGYDRYILIPLPYRELKSSLKYQFS